uniref:Uncharacterized protein n=1 Tax=Anguilla anguilla TaxID=7936 RepID=A0A0E9Q7Z9_ANGAN
MKQISFSWVLVSQNLTILLQRKSDRSKNLEHYTSFSAEDKKGSSYRQL